MRTRILRSDDIPILREFYTESEFAYNFPDLEKLEAVVVVVDENDRPLMAAAAERLIQLYLFCPQDGHPAAKLHGIRLLHQAMVVKLREKGYNSAEAFLPPSIALRFGRRLERSFGWWRNAWTSWTVNF